MATSPQQQELRTWKAKSWNGLRSIWEALVPPATSPGGPVEPRFRSRVLTASEAGTVFERWVLEAFRLSGAETIDPFSVPMPVGGQTKEQLDGGVVDGWQGFLIEAKCWADPVDFAPIALLRTRVESRLPNTLGLFFSTSGYTAPAIAAAEALRPVRVLLFDGDDINRTLNDPKSMMKMVREKWLLALMYGGLFNPNTSSGD